VVTEAGSAGTSALSITRRRSGAGTSRIALIM
jgi:hypothetical protein